MDTRLAKRNYNIQQWKTIIQDRNNTNLTVDEYCKQNGLSCNSYFYWLRIIREEVLEQSSESGFVELSQPQNFLAKWRWYKIDNWIIPQVKEVLYWKAL